MSEKLSFRQTLLSFTLIGLALAPWFFLQFNLRIPADVTFLFSASKMLFEGKSMSEFFYDNNPPMSFFIYYPAILLEKIGLAAHSAIQSYVIGFLFLSTVLSYHLLRQWKSLELTPLFIFLSAYIFTTTLTTYPGFGQKDHLIAIAIIPFILMQLSITYRHRPPKYLQEIVCILYSPFILLKPHFGIIPCALILHRIHKEKSLKAILKPDFIILSLATVAYIVSAYLITPDFFTEILPSSMSYYVGRDIGITIHQKAIAFSLLSIFILIMTVASEAQDANLKKLATAFSTLALLSVIPFWVQHKGFSIHLYPSFCLVSISACWTIYLLTKEKFPIFFKNPYASIIIVSICFYLVTSTGVKIMTKDEYKNSSLCLLLEDKAGNQPFFMETYTTNIVGTASFYCGNAFASRFPSLWFIAFYNELSQSQKAEILQKYGEMIAQDFERHEPKLVGFVKHSDPDTSLRTWLQKHESFSAQWKHYEYNTTYTLSQDEYTDFLFHKAIQNVEYDIYLRK